jgi:hypothetical protein
MISQADLQTIATVFGKTSDEISGAISTEEEVSLGLRLNGRIISQEDELKLKEDSFKRGSEIRAKEIFKELEIDYDEGDHKNESSFIAEKIKTKLHSTLEDKFKNQTPSDREKEIEQKLIDSETKYNKLKDTYEEATGKIAEWEDKFTGLQSEIKDKELNNKILSALPEKLKIDKSDALLITRNSMTFENTDNGIIVKRDGQLLTDSVGNPEKIENVVKSFAEDKKWVGGQSGMGGGDDKDKGLPKNMTYEEAKNYIIKQGKDPMSDEGLDLFSKITGTKK